MSKLQTVLQSLSNALLRNTSGLPIAPRCIQPWLRTAVWRLNPPSALDASIRAQNSYCKQQPLLNHSDSWLVANHPAACLKKSIVHQIFPPLTAGNFPPKLCGEQHQCLKHQAMQRRQTERERERKKKGKENAHTHNHSVSQATTAIYVLNEQTE